MIIEGDSSNRKGFYSVECNTCFNPFSEKEPVFLAKPGDRLGHHKAFQVAKAHELEMGEDHQLVLTGWGSYDSSKMPQIEQENYRIRFDYELQAAGKRLNDSYYNVNVEKEDYDLVFLIDQKTRTFSFSLTPYEIEKSPESIAYLFEKLGIARSDDVNISLGLFPPETFSIIISPQKVTDKRLGIILNNRGYFGIICADNNGTRTYLLEDYRDDLPKNVKNFMETYWLIDNSLIGESSLMQSTVVDAAFWMETLLEKRKKFHKRD